MDVFLVICVLGTLIGIAYWACDTRVEENEVSTKSEENETMAPWNWGPSCLYRSGDGLFYIKIPKPQMSQDKRLYDEDGFTYLFWSHDLSAGYSRVVKDVVDNLDLFGQQIPIDLVCSVLYAEQIWGGQTLHSMRIDKEKIMDNFNRAATEKQKNDVEEFSLFIRRNRLPFYYDGIETVG